MKTFDIGVDLDGVGYNLQASLAPFARKCGYRQASESSWNRIDPETGWHGGFYSWGISDYDEFLDLCRRASREGGLYASGAPFAGFVSMMKTLAGDGHRLHIITARTKSDDTLIAKATRAWLGEWVIPYRTLSFSADKASRRTDLFIEDTVSNYEALLESGMTVPYLVTRSWNRSFQAENRVEDLPGFVTEVRKQAGHTLPATGDVQGPREVLFLAP